MDDNNSQMKSMVMQAMSQPIDNISINYSQTGMTTTSNTIGMLTTTAGAGNTVNAVYSYPGGVQQVTPWGYIQDWYYPYIIRESYPVYLQEKFMDKGKQAFEILKALMDKKIIDSETMKVKDFVEAMDTILKAL